jgi:hypothetical protein
MKLPGIRLIPVEFEIGGQTSAKCVQPRQQFVAAGFARDAESRPSAT